jgi:hypothetical protein
LDGEQTQPALGSAQQASWCDCFAHRPGTHALDQQFTIGSLLSRKEPMMSTRASKGKDKLPKLKPKKKLTPAERRLMSRLEANQEVIFNEMNAVLTKHRLGVSIKYVTFRKGKTKIARSTTRRAEPCGFYVCICDKDYGEICVFKGCP